MRLLSANEVLLYSSQFDCPEPSIRAELLDDQACGPALRVYLALTCGRLGGDLTPEDRLYNRYLWYLRFAHAYRASFGEDVGIDQQAFQILEYPNCDVDWRQIEQLEEEARRPY